MDMKNIKVIMPCGSRHFVVEIYNKWKHLFKYHGSITLYLKKGYDHDRMTY